MILIVLVLDLETLFSPIGAKYDSPGTAHRYPSFAALKKSGSDFGVDGHVRSAAPSLTSGARLLTRVQTNIKPTWSNKTLAPTRVGALSSAFAVHVFWSRVAQLCRYAQIHRHHSPCSRCDWLPVSWSHIPAFRPCTEVWDSRHANAPRVDSCIHGPHRIHEDFLPGWRKAAVSASWRCHLEWRARVHAADWPPRTWFCLSGLHTRLWGLLEGARAEMIWPNKSLQPTRWNEGWTRCFVFDPCWQTRISNFNVGR